jgi:hypothetical protein
MMESSEQLIPVGWPFRFKLLSLVTTRLVVLASFVERAW